MDQYECVSVRIFRKHGKHSKHHLSSLRSRQTGTVFSLWAKSLYGKKVLLIRRQKIYRLLHHQLSVFRGECVSEGATLTCSPDSLEAVWDGFPVSNNHKSHCFRPRGTESGPAWRSPTWWLQTTTERDRQMEERVGKTERKSFEFLQILQTLPHTTQTRICTAQTLAMEITQPCLLRLAGHPLCTAYWGMCILFKARTVLHVHGNQHSVFMGLLK